MHSIFAWDTVLNLVSLADDHFPYLDKSYYILHRLCSKHELGKQSLAEHNPSHFPQFTYIYANNTDTAE